MKETNALNTSICIVTLTPGEPHYNLRMSIVSILYSLINFISCMPDTNNRSIYKDLRLITENLFFPKSIIADILMNGPPIVCTNNFLSTVATHPYNKKLHCFPFSQLLVSSCKFQIVCLACP